MPRWILLLLATLTACQSTPPPSPRAATGAEREVVKGVLMAYVEGRQARDVEAVRALLDPSVDQLTSRGEWRRGVEAAVAGMSRSSNQNPGERTLEVESVRIVGPGAALADARYTIAGTDGAPDRVLWSSFTLVRDAEGSWRIAAIRNMKPAP